MTSRSVPVVVSQCVCKATQFKDLLAQAKVWDWDLAALMGNTGCGAQCGLCRPYLKRMLQTGETVFYELLAPDGP